MKRNILIIFSCIHLAIIIILLFLNIFLFKDSGLPLGYILGMVVCLLNYLFTIFYVDTILKKRKLSILFFLYLFLPFSLICSSLIISIIIPFIFHFSTIFFGYIMVKLSLAFSKS